MTFKPDKTVFKLDGASFEVFVAALDNPPAPNQKLKDLLARKSPWAIDYHGYLL